MEIKVKHPRLGGAVYILPNLLTTGNLFFGFFAIIKGLQGNFGVAAIAILVAAVFDVFDGRVARMTGASSEFGVQYDSLCDLVSFGLAPAFLMYQYGLSELGRIGWAVCFLFLACGALRLARFNVQSSIGKASGDFTGLPIPMAAAVVVCFIALLADLKGVKDGPVWQMTLATWADNKDFTNGFFLVSGFGLAMAMVSNITYRSHKTFKVKAIKPFKLLVLAVALTSVIAFQPELLGFLFFFLYALSGPLEWLLGWKKPVEEEDIFAQEHDESEEGSH